MKFYQNWEAARYNPETKELYETFKANVPGNVQYDYAVSHGFGDIQYSDNVKQFKKIEDYWWIYKTKINYELKAGESLWFVSEGIDYKFDIALDDNIIYSYEGMFSPVEIDITQSARKDSEISVIIHPHPKREGAGDCRDQADQSCKPPFCYGWDWNPRLLISGIWRDTYLETRDSSHINSCEPFYTLNKQRTSADVKFVTDCLQNVTYTVKDADGNVVYHGTDPEFTINNINLWWCNGQGDPYLYSYTAETSGHSVNGSIGFRTVELVMNTGATAEPKDFPKSRYPAPITIELNGRRIFAQGSNWVNPELFTGMVTKERYRELLTLASEANMNILRIWGGSGLNKPEFYELCDELGIMVWQEFMLSCNNYIGTEKYLSVLKKEAVSVIRQLRSHPSIVLWCGGNELFNEWSGMTEQSAALRLLNKLCYEEDFERPFIYTSPLFGMAHGGYFFRSTHEDLQDVFQIMNSAKNTAYSEFGVPSIAPVEQLKKIIPENEIFPVKATDAWIEHHGFESWEEDSWVFPSTLEHYFGKPSSIEEMVDNSALLQETGYKAIFEEARKQWPYCSVAINWCFDEPWITAAGNSLISYPNIKKSGYNAVKDSLRPVLASARIPRFDWKSGSLFSAELWLLNNSNDTVYQTITAIIEINGSEYEQISWKTGDVAARTNKLGPTVNFKIPECDSDAIMTLKLKTQDGSADSLYKLKVYASAAKRNEKKLNG